MCYYYYYYNNYYYNNVAVAVVVVTASCTLTRIRHFERTGTVPPLIYDTVTAHHSVAGFKHSHYLEFLMKEFGLKLLLQAVDIYLLEIIIFRLKLILKPLNTSRNHSKSIYIRKLSVCYF
jgi:hypothetical protein